MKKILIATTALVATATVASADTTVKGRAAFGVYSETGVDAFLQSDVDITIVGSTETDSGVKLTATVNLEDFGNDGVNFFGYNNSMYNKAGSTSDNTVIGISSGALSFNYGNTDGAIDAATTEVHRILGINAELASVGVDNDDAGAIARISYAAGPATLHLSYAGSDDAVGIGVKYKADAGSAKVTFGAGYEDSNGGDIFAVSVGADFGAFGARIAYADGSDSNFDGNLDFSVQYSANGLTVGANYLTDDNGKDDYTIFGSYSLGGGASLFAQHGERGTTKRTSMGVAFAF